jgi:hypothetical protein
MEYQTPEPGKTLTKHQFDAMTVEERRAHFGRMTKEERAILQNQVDAISERIKTLGEKRILWQNTLKEQDALIEMAANDGDVEAVMRHRARRDALPVVLKATEVRIDELHKKKLELIQRLNKDGQPITPGFMFEPPMPLDHGTGQ